MPWENWGHLKRIGDVRTESALAMYDLQNVPNPVEGMKEAGEKIGAHYPVTPYQNFEPKFPKPYKVLAEELGLFK